MAKAAAEALDPALVAALILQESTFDPTALSRAGRSRPHAGHPRHGTQAGARHAGPLPSRVAARSQDQPGLRHPLPSADGRPLRQPHRARARRLQRRAAPRRRLDGAATRAIRRGVRGEHPLHRDPRLRDDHPGRTRAVPTALRAESRAPLRWWKDASRELPDRRLQDQDRPRGAEEGEGGAPRRARRRPASARGHHPALQQARGRLRPHRGRRHAGHLHREHRGARAALPEGKRRRLGHCGVLHAAAGHLDPRPARGLEGRALGPHPRDPASHRAVASGRS